MSLVAMKTDSKAYLLVHCKLPKQVSHSQSDFLLTTTTIVKTVIGSGILALPYTMDQMGFIFGSALFIIAGLMVYFGSFLLLKVKNLSHHSNFSTIFY